MNNKGCVLRPKKGPDIISEISAIRDSNFEEGRHQVPDTPQDNTKQHESPYDKMQTNREEKELLYQSSYVLV